MPTGQALIDHMQNTPVLPNSLIFYGLGQMGIAIKGPDGVVYIDPCLSDIVRERFGEFWVRGFAPPIAPDAITNCACCLSSHEHIDHLDPATLGPIAAASPDARFVVTGWSLDLVDDMEIADERVIVPNAFETITLPGTSARLTAVPSAHYELDYDRARGYRWFGYLIEWNGVTFYHSGDTIIYNGYMDALRRLPAIDVAMLPCNGRDWERETDAGAIGNLLPMEAARLARDLEFGLTIIGHNDLFPNNAIPFGQIADAFAARAPRRPYKVLQPGEVLYFVK